MGLFGLPKCPHCGGKTEETGYSFPYPQLRCRRCIATNKAKREQEEEIEDLKRRIEKLGG